MPIDLKELNIRLASSDDPIVRVAGMAVRAIRRMPVDFYPGGDREKFNLLLKQENGEALKRRNLNKNK